jgi:hypothetical protein
MCGKVFPHFFGCSARDSRAGVSDYPAARGTTPCSEGTVLKPGHLSGHGRYYPQTLTQTQYSIGVIEIWFRVILSFWRSQVSEPCLIFTSSITIAKSHKETSKTTTTISRSSTLKRWVSSTVKTPMSNTQKVSQRAPAQIKVLPERGKRGSMTAPKINGIGIRRNNPPANTPATAATNPVMGKPSCNVRDDEFIWVFSDWGHSHTHFTDS